MLRSTAAGRLNATNWADARGLAIRGAQFALMIAAMLLILASVSRSLVQQNLLNLGSSAAAVLCICGVLLFDQISALRASVLRGLDHPVAAQAPEMIVRPTVLIAGFSAIVWAERGQATVLHALLALVIAAMLSALVGQFSVHRMAPRAYYAVAPRFETRSWILSSTPIALSAGLLYLNAYIGILALGLLADVAQVGLFRVAVQVSLVSGLAYTALNMIASQRFAHFRASNDLVSAQTIATTMARIATVGSLPILLILIFAGEKIVPQLFGEDFGLALAPMIILSIGQVITSATGMAQPLLVMHGLERIVAQWTLLAVLINIVACVILIPSYGVVGAALATTVAAMFWKLSLLFVARRHTQIDTSVLGRVTL